MCFGAIIKTSQQQINCFCQLALKNCHDYSGGYRGVAMVSAETPSERARAPNQRRLVSRRAKITLKYG